MALGETADEPADELIGVPEPAGGVPAAPELPPLRIRGSLAARIVALVVLVVLGTGVAALIIRAQVRGLGENFDLLTGVYIPFQTKLLSAQLQSQRIGTFVGDPGIRVERDALVKDALALRSSLVLEAYRPLEQAMLHPDRVGGRERLGEVRELARLVEELEELVEFDEDELNEIITDATRQAEITRRFADLQNRAYDGIRHQRDTVAQGVREAQRRALVVTIAAAAVSLLATLLVILTLRPLRRLAVSVRRIGRGEWRERIEVGERPERDDEVARLAREVNLMAATLEERERRLLHGERLAAVGRLAAQITHEIRNPLSSVALNAELLEDEIDSLGEQDRANEARELLTRITSEVDRLTQITEAYLDLARRPAPQMAKIDLGREIDDLLDFLDQEHQRNRVSIVREFADAPVWVDADAGQLRQAMLNLLRNAQEAVLEDAGDPFDVGSFAAGRGSDVGDLLDDLDDDPASSDASAVSAVGTITVSLACKEGVASVVVADSGSGIPVPAGGDLDQIFDAFVTSKAHGTGLGLPMVQQIAVDHGGAVRLLETGPSGTRFEFRLPACDPPAPSVSSANSA